MDILSGEQYYILEQVKLGKNVIVDAVAGSGKSTTILSIADHLPYKNTLQLTYNSSLRIEIKEKVKNLNLKNLKIHTYHSLAVRYYLPSSYTDTGIRYILYNDLPPREQIPLYDIVVIDEAQDMTLDYFKFVRKFISDLCKNNNHKVQLVILGDVMQGLYEFKGSDTRFLSLANEIWENNPNLLLNEFSNCTMKMSFRITNQICHFVNNIMLGENRMDSCRDGEPIKYIRNSRTNIEKIVIYEIKQLLGMGVKPSEIFILGGSVKGANSNIRKMENVLVSEEIPCHVPMLETNDKIDERVIDKKIVFSNFHCVKGRQRKYVFIIGFDNGYMDFYARNIPKEVCPNTLYVGVTRATDGLYLLENDQYATDKPLKFLKKTHHEMKSEPYINFKGIPRTIFYDKEEESRDKTINLTEKIYTTPTELIKFIPDKVIEEISPILERIYSREPTFPLDEPSILNDDSFDFIAEIINEGLLDGSIDIIQEKDNVSTSIREGSSKGTVGSLDNVTETKAGFFEEVSDLNGIAIPAMYYDYLIGEDSNILYDVIQDLMKDFKPNQHTFLRNIINELPKKCTRISEYLYMANVYLSCQEKLYFKLKQIDKDEYNWIPDSIMENCIDLLKTHIGKECIHQKPTIESNIIQYNTEDEYYRIDELLKTYFGENQQFRFKARVDLITESSVWELKCTSNISIDHLLQLVIYAWIWRMTRSEHKEFKILNIKTGELKVLNAEIEDLTSIVVSLLRVKVQKPIPLTDDEFIKLIKI